MILVSKIFVPKGFRGITFFPFIFLKYRSDKNNPVLINHEKIHLKQQLELLILPFFIWYIVEYYIRIIQYKSKSAAYRNISFEREAYQHENNLNYLKSRGFWKFIKYLYH